MPLMSYFVQYLALFLLPFFCLNFLSPCGGESSLLCVKFALANLFIQPKKCVFCAIFGVSLESKIFGMNLYKILKSKFVNCSNIARMAGIGEGNFSKYLKNESLPKKHILN